MKIHKIILTIAALMLFTNVLPKVYFNTVKQETENLTTGWKLTNDILSKTENVLDLSIFLDRYKSAGGSPEKWTSDDSGIHATYNQLQTAIYAEEAIIASSIFIRRIMNKKDEQNENTLKNLNNKNIWLKLVPLDQEFIILIPKNKYPDIKTKNDIEKIGLNSKILEELNSIDSTFYKSSEKKQQERIIKISENAPAIRSIGLINLDTLLQIFSNTPQAKKIMKRIFLSGHGWIQSEKIQSQEKGPIKVTKPKSPTETYGYIAQLSPNQYVKLLDGLREIGCSFFNVLSCYASGWNALSLQNATFYDQNNIFKKFENITQQIPFIVISYSLPDETVKEEMGGNFGIYTLNFNISKFFTDINKFFTDQRKSLKDYLKTEKLAIPNDNDISETDILTGKLVKQKKIDIKTGKIAGYTDEKISLIEQQPWLINSMTKIISNLAPEKNTGDRIIYPIFSVRFPGAPFFRASTKTPESKLDELIIEKSEIPEIISVLDHNIKQYINHPPFANDLRNAKNAKEQLIAREKKIESEISEINSGQFPEIPLKIDYPFLVKQHITTGEREYLSALKTKSLEILLYPSVINLPIQIMNPDTKIISMIPGRAQHYIIYIQLIPTTKKNKNNFYEIFKTDSQATKLYFIQSLDLIESKNALFNLTLKIEQNNIDYIYADGLGMQYCNKSGQKLDTKTAENTIKEWILQTTPAKEAIHEATAGIENIYKIRIKMNQIFENMFSPEELGKNQNPQKSVIKIRQKPAPIKPVNKK